MHEITMVIKHKKAQIIFKVNFLTNCINTISYIIPFLTTDLKQHLRAMLKGIVMTQFCCSQLVLLLDVYLSMVNLLCIKDGFDFHHN